MQVIEQSTPQTCHFYVSVTDIAKAAMLLVPAPQGKLCLTGTALSRAHFPLILERKVELSGTPQPTG